MIGGLPAWEQAAREYGQALDVAATLLMGRGAPLVRCAVPPLAAEVEQRLSCQAEQGPVSAALWVEPLPDGWRSELDALAGALAPGGRLVVVASRPLACLLSAQSPGQGPLGRRPGGLLRLWHAMSARGLSVEVEYGLHTATAIGLNLLAHLVARWGRPDLGDRLNFAGRLRYCTAGALAPLSTVALLLAHKRRSAADGNEGAGKRS